MAPSGDANLKSQMTVHSSHRGIPDLHMIRLTGKLLLATVIAYMPTYTCGHKHSPKFMTTVTATINTEVLLSPCH